MRVPRLLLPILLITAGGLASAANAADETPPPEKPCREHPQLVGECFTVHGRMSYWNGMPSVRIWKIGTHRILGVSEGLFSSLGYRNLPVELRSRLNWSTDLFGDFLVCPFTDEKPGAMQFVCVESASDLVERNREDRGR